jgi:hypothetical protein
MEAMRESWTDDRMDLNAKVDALHLEMRTEFKAIRGEMKEEFAAVRSEMREEFKAVRSEMKDEFKAVRAEMKEGFDRMEERFDARLESFYQVLVRTCVLGVAILAVLVTLIGVQH